MPKVTDTVRTDARRRIVLPGSRSRQLYRVERPTADRYLLILQQDVPRRKATLVRRHGYLMLRTERAITTEETLTAIAENVL